METARLILAIILLLFAAFVVVMNWVAVGISTRNKRRGIDHHSSMVPLMSVLVSTIAFFIYPYRPAEWVFIIPLIDLSNWCLLWWPILLLKERNTKNTTEQDGTSNGG